MFEGHRSDSFAEIVSELRTSLGTPWVQPRDESELSPLDWALRLAAAKPAKAPLVSSALATLVLDASLPNASLLFTLERASWPIIADLDGLIVQASHAGLANRPHDGRNDGRSVLGGVVHLLVGGGSAPKTLSRAAADVLGDIREPKDGWPLSALAAAASAPDPWADRFATMLAGADTAALGSLARLIINTGSPLTDRALDAFGSGAPIEARDALWSALEAVLVEMGQPLDAAALAYLPDELKAMALANQAARARTAASGPDLQRRLGVTS